ncbi:CvpA family protein [bacterium]|nr:CvpA family protein [bacterium]
MNIIDLTLILCMAFFLIKGFIRGIILEVFTGIGMVAAYVLALREADRVAAFYARFAELPGFIYTALGFLSIFFAVIIIFRVAAVILHKIIKKTPVATLDRGGGLVIGLLKGLLASSLIAHLVLMIPAESGDFERERDQSILVKPSKAVAPFLFNVVKHAIPRTKTFSDELEESVNRVMQQAQNKVNEKVQDTLENQLNDTIPSQ